MIGTLHDRIILYLANCEQGRGPDAAHLAQAIGSRIDYTRSALLSMMRNGEVTRYKPEPGPYHWELVP